MAPGPMNEEGLRKLAEQTGGKFYREEDLHQLPDEVQSQKVTFTPAEGNAALDVLAGAGRWWCACSRWSGWCGSSAI